MENYEIIRSNRRTVALQILPEGRVVVRCPVGMPESAIRSFVESKQQWLQKHLKRPIAQPNPRTMTQEQLRDLARRAAEYLPKRVAYYAPMLGVNYGRITIRSQRTRWGSCSSKGNLNFNCLLMLAPPQVQDYVVIHELCHRLELNHSSRFWALVEKLDPQYRTHRKWLKDNGGRLIASLPK